jgi:hypothetical protein
VKGSEYNNEIINSANKMKTTWKIIKSETNRLKGHDTFNDHFLSLAEKIMQNIRHCYTDDTSDNKDPTYYLSKISHNPFPNIKCNNTSTKEIKLSNL